MKVNVYVVNNELINHKLAKKYSDVSPTPTESTQKRYS